MINLARFDLVTLRLAILCAESGTLSAAARLAHFSVSAGSQRLSALESVLVQPLFLRDRRGLQPTDVGVLVVARAKAILHEIELLQTQVRAAAPPPENLPTCT